MTDTAPPALTGPGRLTGLLDEVVEISAQGSGRVAVSDILDRFGQKGLLPLMLILALIVFSPLSGIPFLPTICGTMIFLIAIQMAAGRAQLWLPGWMRRRTLPGPRLAGGIARIRPAAVWLDRHSGRRLAFLTTGPAITLLQLACGICGIAMPFLELVPLSSSMLGLAISLMGLAMLTKDGLWAAVAFLPICAAVALIVTIWF